MGTFCSLPWTGLDIDPQGGFKPCCKYNQTVAQSLDEYESSNELAQLKQDFLQGKRPSGCSRCWQDEDSGIQSKRQLDFEYVFNNQTPNLDSIKILGITFGNTCNLACRTCKSFASSRWRTEEEKLIKIFSEIIVHKHQQFYKDANFIQQILDRTENVMHVEFAGGEPFIAGIDEHLLFLDAIIANRPGDVTLHYVTNTTTFPDDRFWQRWSQFKKVDIQLSIDGIGPQFEYNRWPANWEQCLINIKKYQESQSGNMQLSISHCVSMFTVYYLPEFINWCQTQGLPDPYLGPVVRPEQYAITVFPNSVKTVIAEKLKQHKLDHIVNLLWTKDDSQLFDKFRNYVIMLDKQRNQSFAQTFPELNQLIGDTCQISFQS